MGNCFVREICYIDESEHQTVIRLYELIVLNELMTRKYANGYDVLVKWRKFLAEKPILSNFEYFTESMILIGVRLPGVYHMANTPLHAYCGVKQYTDRCSLVLSEDQKATYDRFVAMVSRED